METAKLLDRVKAILFSPKGEWAVIAAEPATTKSLYTRYILILAAIPALAGFIKSSLIGHGAFGIHVRMPVMSGLASMIVGYVLSLVLVYVMALIINTLATRFQGNQDTVQALKTAGYAWTAAWVAGIAVIVPGVGWLLALAGGVYSIYLLYTGLPHTMRCPPQKSGAYTAVSVVIAVVLGWILSLVLAAMLGTGLLGGSALAGIDGNGNRPSVTFDKDSKLGKLMAMGDRMQAAGERMERAQAKSDGQAAQEAMQGMFGAMAGGEDGKPVESMEPAQLKAFLPEALGDLERKSLSAERQGAMGIQISNARAVYETADGKRRVTLELADAPVMGGVMSMAGVLGAGESERQTEHGYEKNYVRNGQKIHEKWDSRRGYGEYGITVADRVSVKVKGNARDIEQLKDIAASLDLQGLERATRG